MFPNLVLPMYPYFYLNVGRQDPILLDPLVELFSAESSQAQQGMALSFRRSP
jgi:hypothetical protein